MKLSRLFQKKFKKLSLSVVSLFLVMTAFTVQPYVVSLAEEVDEPTQKVLDFNEVGVHDPSIIKVEDMYYVFGSHGAAARSTDLMNWTNFVKEDVTDHTLLGNIKENLEDAFKWAGVKDAADMDQLGVWAPDVIYNDAYDNKDGTKGAYLMYFSLSTGKEEGKEHYRSLIGLATSKNIEGPFVYQDAVVYSGFSNKEGNSHYSNTDFKDYFPNSDPRTGYFYSDGSFNFDLFPNAIDPNIIEGAYGKLYMTYGSWNGGIYVLELNSETGLPERQEEYNNNNADAYFGTKIARGYKRSGEGPYIQYHKESKSYHLYITYGGLMQDSSYNVRFFKSDNIEGPYLDSNGNNAILNNRDENENVGNKILGSFDFLASQAIVEDAQGYDYRVPGHNSVLYGDDGKDYLVFHTRFKNTGEHHQLRVHQLLFDEDGWPLVAPQRYEEDETVLTQDIDLSGTMQIVIQTQDSATQSKVSQVISLDNKGKVTGAQNGTWSVEEGQVIITLGETTYKGYALKQSTPLTNWYEDITVTLLSDKGESLLGIKTSSLTPEEVLNNANKNLVLDETVKRNLRVPSSMNGTSITWATSDANVMTADGIVTQTDKKQTVTLTATLKFGSETTTKTFNIEVLPKLKDNYVEYKFENNLSEEKDKLGSGTIVGTTIDTEGGSAQYRDGIVRDENGQVGKAFYFDGTTGIKLPENLIDTNIYSISLWLKPEQLTSHTTSFFGGTPNKWISLLPGGFGHDAILWSGENWYNGITGFVMTPNMWTHVVFSVDEGNVKVYIDGDLKHSGTTFPDVFTGGENNKFALGVNYWDTPFKGLIDDLRIYQDDVITSEEVKTYFEESLTELDPSQVAEETFDTIELPEVVGSDLELATQGLYGSTLSWKSSHKEVISNNGEVTRPEAGKKDVAVTLTATLIYEGVTFTKTYKVLVKALPQPIDYLYYSFDNTLDEKEDSSLIAKLHGDKIGVTGGVSKFKKGIKGNAFYFNGETGLSLPDDMITSDTYTVSFWMNPESVTDYTSAFFGHTNEKWVSVAPSAHEGTIQYWSNYGPELFNLAITNEQAKTNTWTHVAITDNKGKATVYVDGKVAAEVDGFPAIFKDSAISNFYLGINHWDVAFKGLIDELMIYPSKVLSKNEISDYYDSVTAVMTPEEKAHNIFAKLSVPSETTSNLVLETKVDQTDVNWSSSNAKVISNKGIVTRPLANQKDATVTLTAKIVVDGKRFTKTFKVLVKAVPETINYLYYSFDNTLKEDTNSKLSALLQGDVIGKKGGKEQFKKGIKGDAFYFNGETGLLLPDDMIITDTYTVSYWMNPDELNAYTTSFFGGTFSKWISVLPGGFGDDAVLWSGETWYDGFSNTNVTLNDWTHVTVTNNKGKVAFYLNGKKVHEGNNFPDLFKHDETKQFALGINHWDVPFKGLIDELIVYPTQVLREKQVAEYYDSILNEMSPEEKAASIFAKLALPKETTTNLDLKSKVDDVSVRWSTSNGKVITNKGVITRPASGLKDASATLSANIIVDGKTFSKDFKVIVKALPSKENQILYSFEKNLDATDKKNLQGKVFGDLIDKKGGSVSYKAGILGDAVYLNGNTSIRLPDNLIKNNTYTISMWLNPEQLTDFTTVFFAGSNFDRWISLVPKSGHENHGNSGLLWSGEEWYDGLFNQRINANQWQHVAFSVDNGVVKIYIDGKIVHEGNNFPNVFNTNGTNIFSIGANYWDVAFKGFVDEVMIVPNDVLSSEDIKAYHASVLSQLTPEKLLEQFFAGLTFGDNGVVTKDLKLPGKTNDDLSIKWTSNNQKYLTNIGKVTRPSIKEGDQKVKLTAVVLLDGKPYTFTYNLIIKAESIKVDSVHYNFEDTLEEASKLAGLTGITTGALIDQKGSKAKYAEGKVGQGLYLDGTSGVRLPDNLITSNKYSVSMWLKPEQLTDFTTTFFGYKNADSWVSFTPQGVASQAVLWSGTQWYDGLTNFVMTPNMWTHIAFTVDNGKVNVYVDGSLRHSGTDFPNIFSESEDSVFALGVNYWDTPFKGIIDEFMVHNTKILSAQEVYDYYDETVGSDRFVRNVNRSMKLEFEQNIGAASVTGDKLDNFGGSVSYEEGVVGDAVYLNGNTGLKLPSGFLSSNTYSMQMWVKPESITQFTSIFFGGTSPSSWVNLPASGIDGKTMFWSGENWYDAITPDSIPANKWSHLAVSVSNGNIQVYIDGQEKFSGTDFPDIFTSPNSFAAIGVNFWDDAFRGLIDEFELHNNMTLSAADVEAYYEETKPEQDEFTRNQEKTHVFKFEDDLVDDMNDELTGSIVGGLISEEGGTIDYVEGKDGKAAYFDGSSGVLLPKELITSENYSVSLWVKPEVITAHTTTFFGAQNDSSWVSVVPESGEFTNGNSMVWSGTNWYDGNLGTQIPVDEWSHIAFTVNEGTLSAYLNGDKVFSEPGFPDIFNAEDSVFALGVNYWDEAFVGSMDEVMVFDAQVLSDEDVAKITSGEFDIGKDFKDVEKSEIEEKTSTITYAYVAGGVVGMSII